MICLPELSEFFSRILTCDQASFFSRREKEMTPDRRLVGSKNGSLFRNSTIFSSGNFLRKCPYHLTPFQSCWNFWSNGKGPTSHFQLCFISWRKRSNKVLWHSFIANCDSLTEKGVNQEMCENRPNHQIWFHKIKPMTGNKISVNNNLRKNWSFKQKTTELGLNRM